MKSFLSLFVGLFVTALALTYALWDVDLKKLVELFGGLNYWAIFPFLGLLTVFFWLKALRWTVILRPLGRFKLAQVTPAMMIGFGANNILPAHLEELLRTVVFARRSRKSYSGVLASLALERLLDVTAILLLYVVVVSMNRPPTGVLTSAVAIAAGMTAGAFAVIFFVLWKPHRPHPSRVRDRAYTFWGNARSRPGRKRFLLGSPMGAGDGSRGRVFCIFWIDMPERQGL